MNNQLKNLNKKQKPKSNRKTIFNWVFTAHIAVIFLPLALLFVTQWLKPALKKPEVIVVNLVSDSDLKATNDPVLRPPSPDQPRKKITKVKPKLKPKTKPKTINKPKIVKTKHNTAKAKPKVVKTKPQQTQNNSSIYDDIVPYTGPETKSQATINYETQLATRVYKLWNPPSTTLLNGRRPEVTIRIRLNSFGRVISAKIIKSSNFRPMNLSVEQLLKRLTMLPRPISAQREFEILLVATQDE